MSQAPRVTFTDWKGSLLVYSTIWLTPVYLAYAFTKSPLPWLLAPFIFLVMMAQHKLHRATGLTTAARYIEIDRHRELRGFLWFTVAALCYGAPLAAAAAGGALALATFLLVLLYSGPMHREWWIGFCHFLGTMSCFLMVRLPTLPEMLFCAGFSSMIWMLHKGLRIVTGDYGSVPVDFKHIAEVFVAWALGVALMLAGVALS